MSKKMPCLLVALILLFPRVAIVLLYLFTNFFHTFASLLWPLLGLIFLPLTLIAYTWMTNSHYPRDITFLVVIVIALILDLGLLHRGARSRRRR